MKPADNALAFPGTAAADLDRFDEEEVPPAFPDEVEALLEKLRPFEGWEQRLRALLHKPSKIRGAPNPAGWAGSTIRWHLGTLVRILLSCDAASLPTTSFGDLQTTAALTVLEQRLRRIDTGSQPRDPTPSGVSEMSRNTGELEANWGGVYLCSVLRSLRTCLRAAGISASSDLTSLITFYSEAEARNVNHRLRTKDEYLAGAAVLDAFGRIASASGRRRGTSIRIGARLLAVAADGSPRRAEAGLADRRLVRRNPMAETPEIEIFVRRSTSKARRTRVLCLRDPRAIRLVEELRDGAGGHELFRATDGRPLSLSYLDYLLRRMTIMAVGTPASFNLIRRANALARRTTAERTRQLGHDPDSLIANEIYHPCLAQNGHEAITAARNKVYAAAVSAGYISPALTVR